MRVIVLAAAALVAALLLAIPAEASSAEPPGQKPGRYTRWYYPSQMTYGPLENGAGSVASPPASGAFLTLPFVGPHYITSIFDHCGPNYQTHHSVCRYDGTVASLSVGGADPTFDAGYAQTPGGHDYLYYDGHDGYDYGLYYEPIAAAASGTVILAGWEVPSCHSCLSGLTVEIAHGNGLLTYYGHLSRIDVARGQRVSRGEVIGISGMTGSATGPHLHFGVYYLNGAGPIDPYGWSGSYPDPYSKDIGDLWLTGSPRYPDVALPKVTVSATQDPNYPSALDVVWSSPGSGATFAVSIVTQDGEMAPWIPSVGAGSAIYHGQPGQRYWFWVSVRTDLGWSDAGGSRVIQMPALDHGQRT